MGKNNKKKMKKQMSSILGQMGKMFSTAMDQVEVNMLLLQNDLKEFMNTGLTKEEALILIEESE